MAAKQRDGSNGTISGEQIQTYLAEIDEADDKLIELKIDHMNACKGPRGRIRDIMKGARASGVNMAALRALVAEHRAERKAEQRVAELEDDDRADYDAMQEALGAFGETELGQAALRKAKPKRKGDDALDSLRT
jgi:hypothetical protein